jgi:hypothetical protein
MSLSWLSSPIHSWLHPSSEWTPTRLNDFSNTVWSFELFHFSTLHLLHGFYPISWFGALLHWLVSMLSHSLRLLGILRIGKLLILGSTYPWRFSAPKENTGFDARVVTIFQQFFLLPKIWHFYKPWFGWFPSVFNYLPSFAVCSVITITM